MSDKQIYTRVATGHDAEELRANITRSSPRTIFEPLDPTLHSLATIAPI